MKIALAQITSSFDPEENLTLIERYVDEAREAHADVVVFPEATMVPFGQPLAPHAESMNGAWATRVRDIAREAGLVVTVGMFTPADDGRVMNTMLVTGTDDSGADIHTSYDKLHLFDAFGTKESRTVAPGDHAIVVRINGVGVGLATCYDVRFPNLFTALAEAGADIVLLAASWGAGDGKKEMWQTLTSARALDATVFVAAVDKAPYTSGTEGADLAGPNGVGASRVVAPDGREIAAVPDAAPQLLIVDIDPADVAKVREAIPVLENTRDMGAVEVRRPSW